MVLQYASIALHHDSSLHEICAVYIVYSPQNASRAIRNFAVFASVSNCHLLDLHYILDTGELKYGITQYDAYEYI